jgi:hypothetical protein
MKIKTLIGGMSMFLIGSTCIAMLTIIIGTQKASALGEFVTTWKTDVTFPTDNSITLPTNPSLTYDYTIDWGDGTVENNLTSSTTHTYPSAGTYIIRISGIFPQIYMNGYADAVKIQSVESWGNIQWQSMDSAFEGASNLVINASDIPNLNNVTSLAYMFSGARSMNSNINSWNVSGVTNFSYMFRLANSFNQDLSSWDVGNGTTFLGMFFNATNFNQDISGWDMSSATNLQNMFVQARNFNQPIGSWNVSSVSDTQNMFLEAFSFNQSLSGWNTTNLERADFMFFDARNFNQSLGAWNVSSLRNAQLIFNESGISSENYDAILTGWRNTAIFNEVALTGTQVGYCSSSTDRAFLITVLRWVIGDNGVDTDRCRPTSIWLIEIEVPEVLENNENGLVGILATESGDPAQTFAYSFECEVPASDSSFFSVADGELRTIGSFDFENPQDQNGDNIYELCIRSTDTNNLFTDQTFNVTVGDIEESPPDEDQGNSGNGRDDTSGGGQVLGESTNNGQNSKPQSGQVLAETDTLSITGNGATPFIIIGVTIVSVTYLLHVVARRSKVYSIYR